MKKLLSAAVAALAIVGSAEAATFNVGVTANPFRSGVHNDGLQTRAWILSDAGPQNFNGATYSFDLDLANVGATTQLSLYRLVTFDSPVQDDDKIQSPTSMVLDFGGTIGSIQLNGFSGAVAQATSALATFASGFVRVSADRALRIDVLPTVFGTDGNSFVDGRAGAGTVRANFTVAVIPVPAGGILLVGALAGLALLRRRKAL